VSACLVPNLCARRNLADLLLYVGARPRRWKTPGGHRRGLLSRAL